jgi:hypothetical protein
MEHQDGLGINNKESVHTEKKEAVSPLFAQSLDIISMQSTVFRENQTSTSPTISCSLFWSL